MDLLRILLAPGFHAIHRGLRHGEAVGVGLQEFGVGGDAVDGLPSDYFLHRRRVLQIIGVERVAPDIPEFAGGKHRAPQHHHRRSGKNNRPSQFFMQFHGPFLLFRQCLQDGVQTFGKLLRRPFKRPVPIQLIHTVPP